MGIGAIVRKAFGPLEPKVAEAYRELYMSLEDYAAQLHDWAPQASRILEVGGGEGAVTEILAAAYPDAEILSIDIMPQIGRLYRGPRDRVEFREATVQEIAQQLPGQFDLVMLSDVVHHIPQDLRAEVLDALASCIAPGGRFILKDWARTPTPIHWLSYASDRWLTGDKIAYLTPEEMKHLLGTAAPSLNRIDEGRIKPWLNNFTLIFEKPPAAEAE